MLGKRLLRFLRLFFTSMLVKSYTNTCLILCTPFFTSTLWAYHKLSNLSPNEGQGVGLGNIWETHLWLTELIWSDVYWVHMYVHIRSSYKATLLFFPGVHSHITHTSLWGLNQYQINNVQKPLRIPLVSSLAFSGLSFPTCKIPFWDEGHYVSVPRIRAHCFVKYVPVSFSLLVHYSFIPNIALVLLRVLKDILKMWLWLVHVYLHPE